MAVVLQSASGDPATWTPNVVASWLQDNGFGELADVSLYESINGHVLLALTADELKNDPGVEKFGIRKALLISIGHLRSRVARIVPGAATFSSGSSGPGKRNASRRSGRSRSRSASKATVNPPVSLTHPVGTTQATSRLSASVGHLPRQPTESATSACDPRASDGDATRKLQ